MSLGWPPLRASLGILAGALVGGGLHVAARAMLPPHMTVTVVLVGLCAGAGARLVAAIGTPSELRVLVFGSLLTVVGGEYFVFLRAGGGGLDPFTRSLAADPVSLLLTMFFIFAGIFLGVRLLVGNDPLGDVLAHGSDLVPGLPGSRCPRCGSVQTVLAGRSLRLRCVPCGHGFRAGEGPSEPPAPGDG